MNKKEKLALFLGMLSGDGCLPIKHNGKGYRDYAIQFYNTNKEIVELFNKLFFELFKTNGKIHVEERKKSKRKDLFSICKYSKEIYNYIKELGFPEGIKKDKLKVLEIINYSKEKEKLAFIKGFLITDGCIRKNKTIIFHSGSKRFLEDLSALISEIIGITKPIREFVQREIYRSYQLNLNKQEAKIMLSQMPTWDNGNPAALSSYTR